MLTAAIDLGGTRIKLGLVEDGAVAARDLLPSDSAAGLAARLPAVAKALDRLRAGRALDAVGFATPGIVDRRARRITAINAKWADAPGLDLAQWAHARWGAPLTLANDALAALAGEWRHGAAAGCDGAVMLTLGTGIGAAAVVDGRLLHGSHGQAAIAGHLTVQVDGRPCSCGNRGCAEAEASTSALPALARADARFAASALAAEAVLDYAAVFRLAGADPLARDLRARALAVWSALAVSLVHAYDPAVLVVGGGIAAAGDGLLAPLRRHLDAHAWTPWGRVAVRPAALGDDAALLGIAALAQEP
ncbi:MAG: ROK family protein [Planctomycetes bacterium]|nr:ROK family protein [Planctomycetota bacterium]